MRKREKKKSRSEREREERGGTIGRERRGCAFISEGVVRWSIIIRPSNGGGFFSFALSSLVPSRAGDGLSSTSPIYLFIYLFVCLRTSAGIENGTRAVLKYVLCCTGRNIETETNNND